MNQLISPSKKHTTRACVSRARDLSLLSSLQHLLSIPIPSSGGLGGQRAEGRKRTPVLLSPVADKSAPSSIRGVRGAAIAEGLDQSPEVAPRQPYLKPTSVKKN